MIELLEKLLSEDFEDVFKPASEEEITQRVEDAGKYRTGDEVIFSSEVWGDFGHRGKIVSKLMIGFTLTYRIQISDGRIGYFDESQIMRKA